MIDIWKNFNNSLHEYICRKVDQHDHCHDILQDVYIKVMDNIHRLDQVNNLGGYLTRIASNAVNDYYRANSKTTTTENSALADIELIDHADDEPRPEIELADCCLRPMIEQLPDIYRDALIMTELDGLSQKQLAEALGISLSGAKSRVQRAREKLKDVILNCCQYEFDRYGNILGCTDSSC